MEIILLEKIHRLGELGDKVKVKAGYARNFLIPNRRAVPATAANQARVEEARAQLQEAQSAALAEAQARAQTLAGLTVVIPGKAGTEGRLFGSIGTADIARAVSEAGFALAKREVRLPNGPLRELGSHAVELHLHADVDVVITVSVVADDEPVTSV